MVFKNKLLLQEQGVDIAKTLCKSLDTNWLSENSDIITDYFLAQGTSCSSRTIMTVKMELFSKN